MVIAAAVTVQGQSATQSRRQALDELLRILRPSRPPANGRINAVDRTWEDWVRRTGELTPDFEAMPSMPELPDPLLLRENGRTVPVKVGFSARSAAVFPRARSARVRSADVRPDWFWHPRAGRARLLPSASEVVVDGEDGGRHTGSDRCAGAVEAVDASRISLMGYSLGGKVGLLTTALDERVHALAAVSGFDPLRLATGDRGVEGIRHYSHLHGLMPRLGFFVGSEARLPFDFDEPLALASSRPVLLVAPTLDRYARIADVRAAVKPVRGVTLETPVDFNRFGVRSQARVSDWLADANR